jgi:membrane protease YdiL (CAAX protease family)
MTSDLPSSEYRGSLSSHPEVPDGIVLPEPEPPALLPRLGVPLWAPFAVVFAAFVVVLIVQIVVATGVEIGGGDAVDISSTDAATIGFTVVLDVSLVVCTIAIVWWLGAGRPTPASFGLRKPEWLPAIGWMAATYMSFWVVAIIAGLIFGEPEEQDIVVDLKAEDSVLVLAAFGVMTCMLAPLAEEFFFRGFLLRVLAERTNLPVGIVVSGVLFGMVHLPSGDWIGVIVLSAFGIALAGLFILTSSLVPCIMLHALHNSISFGFTKELPWWGFLLLTVGSVTTTLVISLLVARAGRRAAPA